MLGKKRKRELTAIVNELRKSLPQIKAVDDAYLQKCYENKDYVSIVLSIRKQMGIPFQISYNFHSDIALVENKLILGGTINACVSVPHKISRYRKVQKKAIAALHVFGKSGMIRSYNSFVVMIAHELSHLVLWSINHRLKHSEEATDITAMLLGYQRYYENGYVFFDSGKSHKGAYLSLNDIAFVSRLINETHPNENQNVLSRIALAFKTRIGLCKS